MDHIIDYDSSSAHEDIFILHQSIHHGILFERLSELAKFYANYAFFHRSIVVCFREITKYLNISEP